MLIYTYKFLLALIFTVFVETILLWLIIRKIFKFKEGRFNTPNIIFAGIMASFSTIPYVWYIFPILIYWSFNLSLILSEIFAILVEAIFYRFFFNIKFRDCLLISFVCNFASWGLGRLLTPVKISLFKMLF
jgi:hypothetical protein